mgnify:CR=1 FL=1
MAKTLDELAAAGLIDPGWAAALAPVGPGWIVTLPAPGASTETDPPVAVAASAADGVIVNTNSHSSRRKPLDP